MTRKEEAEKDKSATIYHQIKAQHYAINIYNIKMVVYGCKEPQIQTKNTGLEEVCLPTHRWQRVNRLCLMGTQRGQ